MVDLRQNGLKEKASDGLLGLKDERSTIKETERAGAP